MFLVKQAVFVYSVILIIFINLSQQFEWYAFDTELPFNGVIEVNSPSTISGIYSGFPVWGFFSTPYTALNGVLQVASPKDACTPLISNHTGGFCLVEYGKCDVVVMTRNCQNAGAIGVLVQVSAYLLAQNAPNGWTTSEMSDIPALQVTYEFGGLLGEASSNDIVNLTIPFRHCNGTVSLDGSGTFSPVSGALLINQNAHCEWKFTETPKRSYGLAFSPLAILHEDSFVNIYQLDQGVRTLIQSFQGNEEEFVRTDFITSCNPLETELVGPQTQPYCWGIIPPCERGFEGFYYTCPGNNSLRIPAAKFRPGCDSVASCSWIFTPFRDNATEMDIYFTELNLPHDAYINIYQGNDIELNLVATITGTEYKYFHLTGEKVLLEYQAGSEPALSDFTALLHNGGCVGNEVVHYTNLEGNISDGSYNGPYMPNSLCSFLIAPPIPSMIPIELTINWVSVEDTYDFLYIYDGDNAEAPIRAKYTGNNQEAVFYSTGNSMLVALDSDYTVTWDGFSASYRVEPCAAAIEINYGAALLSMGHYSNAGLVSEDVACGWDIISGEAEYIALYLERNELGLRGAIAITNYDTNEEIVITGDTPIGMMLIASTHVGVSYTLPANEMGAFNIISHFGKCTEVAPTFEEMTGTINDGSFNGLYSGITKCNWIISPEPLEGQVYVITLTFDYFETTNLKDFLRVYDNNDTMLAIYSGQTVPEQFQYFGNWLRLEFSVSSVGYQEGFSIQYESFTECPAGYYLKNGTVCSPCGEGTYSSGGLLTSCSNCEAGSYSEAKAANCTLCDIGSYQPLPGKSSCLLCSTGTFANVTGSSLCSVCDAGTFASFTGSTKCEPCQVGKYQDRIGQRECVLCELGYYAPQLGSIRCIGCPKNTVTPYIGTVNLSSCACKPGYYGENGTDCIACPDGGICLGGGQPATAKPGYWGAANNTYFVECLPSSACLGGLDSTCASGYSGDHCGWCDADYWRFRDGCIACAGSTQWYYVLFIFVPLLLVFWTLQSVSKGFRSGALAIMFDFVQVLGLTTAFKMNWPNKLESLFVFASVTNVNLDFLSLECTFSFTYWEKWYFALSIPGLVGGVYALVLLFIRLIQHFVPKLARNTLFQFIFNTNYFINGYMMFLSLAHPFLTAKSLEPLNCIDDGGGRSFILANPAIYCYSPEWNAKLPLAILGIIFYGAGIPFLIWAILYRIRSATNRSEYVERFGSVFAAYSREKWYWEVVVKGRKFLLVMIRFIFEDGNKGDGSLSTSFVAIIILTLYYLIVVKEKPFQYKRNNYLQNVMALVNMFVCVCGLLFLNPILSVTGRDVIYYLMAIMITIVLLIASFCIVRELFFAFRKRPEVRRWIPEVLLRYDIISLEEWELSDADRPLNRDLRRALKMWLYTHSPQETDELVYNLAHNYNLVPVMKSDTPQLFFRRSKSKVMVQPFWTSNEDLSSLANRNPIMARSTDNLKALANDTSQ